MHDTRNADALARALLDLIGCLNSPRQDQVLLKASGIAIDRALFPLLVRLDASPSMPVAQLAELVGRDASTVSRQLAKLEELGLVYRPKPRSDLRRREVAISAAGARTVAAITSARRVLLAGLMKDWSAQERSLFPELMQRLADAMKNAQQTN